MGFRTRGHLGVVHQGEILVADLGEELVGGWAAGGGRAA